MATRVGLFVCALAAAATAQNPEIVSDGNNVAVIAPQGDITVSGPIPPLPSLALFAACVRTQSTRLLRTHLRTFWGGSWGGFMHAWY